MNKQLKAYMVFYLTNGGDYIKAEFDTLEDALDFITSGQMFTSDWYLVKPIRLAWEEIK